jgi:hypothetical protein
MTILALLLWLFTHCAQHAHPDVPAPHCGMGRPC